MRAIYLTARFVLFWSLLFGLWLAAVGGFVVAWTLMHAEGPPVSASLAVALGAGGLVSGLALKIWRRMPIPGPSPSRRAADEFFKTD